MRVPAVSSVLVGWILLSSVSSAAETVARPEKSKAAVQLEVARQKKMSARKTSGDIRQGLLEASVVEYRKVLDQFGGDATACAEAAFRIGEIERSLGNADAADKAFQAVLPHGQAAPRFAARALNELAHLQRRADQPEQAITVYRRVTDEYPDQEAEAVKALTWIGKVEDRRGQHEAAQNVWLSIPDRYPSRPVAAIRAADLAALSALKRGDVDTAREVVTVTGARFSADNKDQEWWSLEVQSALDRMKAKQRLESGSEKSQEDESGNR